MNYKNILYWLVLIIICLQISCGKQDSNGQAYQKVIIYPQETASQVALKLQDNGIIKNPQTFLFWARVLGYDKKIKSGRYRFASNSRVLDILKALSRGGENRALITIPEGYSIKQIGQLLENEGICAQTAFVKACADKTLLASLNIFSANAEGYLFPDSYDFTIDLEPKQVIERMVRRFWQIFSEISETRSFKSIDTIVKIASLVEKEAKLDAERPIIASVFYNRLKVKMPLQSCATVQYILPNHKEVLSIEDTKIDSPYNTYLYPGLPPTPICNPGKAALIAAIKPTQTKYLYFAVAQNGSHHFSQNFAEHQNFLRKRNNH
ncbi:MAG: endolytic transglycosylase MltG [Candidatus Latescibacteria bacterium]|nr:endolytic transglycosylase MltG [Candidatus Latescibacterota bacterium]